MAYTTINDPTKYFNTSLYTGDYESGGAIKKTQAIIGLGFQPDLNWIKNREPGDDWHIVTDSSRGVTKNIFPNDDADEVTHTERIKSLDSDGFTIGNDINVNTTEETFVSWNWKANGGTTTSGGGNDTVSTSAYQANTTAGFSIVTYTGTGSAATVAHGLGVAPQVVLVKRRDGSDASWDMYHASIDETDAAQLDTTAAFYDSATYWNDTAPTSSVFTVGSSSETNQSGQLHVAYCWAPIQGYSNFGSYTGNGNSAGTFVYTGFKPAWLMIKRADSTNDWAIYDNKRDLNGNDKILKANATEAEDTASETDLLSNGFKMRSTSLRHNASDATYVYLAFAEAPFVTSNGSPNNAR